MRTERAEETEGRGADDMISAPMSGFLSHSWRRRERISSADSVSRSRGSGRGRPVVFVRARLVRREGVIGKERGVVEDAVGRDAGRGEGEEDMRSVLLESKFSSSEALRFRELMLEGDC